VIVAIFLIRHGQTAANAMRVIQVPAAPLDRHGILQAERLARRLATEGISDILSSDFPRAMMTAEQVRLATAARLHIDSLLEERNFGELRGRPYDSLGFDFMADGYEPPQGETWPEFHARVDRAWVRIRDLAAAAEGSVAVVTHGLVCDSLAERHLRLRPGMVLPSRFENTSVTVVEARPPWQIELLNDTSHLVDGSTRETPQSTGGLV
jgi:probable phosphoglycerate mutase